MVKIIATLDQLHNVIKELNTNSIMLLQGDLASGKTTLVKEFVKSLGIDEDVSSPTFSIMNIYDNKVYHYDIYNNSTAKFIESGLLENLELKGYHMIEWADEKFEDILNTYGFRYTTIKIQPTKDNKREYTICTN